MSQGGLEMSKFLRIISLAMTIIIILSISMTAFATTYDTTNVNAIVIYDDGETKIDGYEDAFGNTILRQYLNGKLIQRNTISSNNSHEIKREFFDTTSRKVSIDKINVNDYGKLEKTTNNIRPMSSTLAGTINYSAAIDTGVIYYGLRCTYDTVVIGPTTYTINGFVGTLIDLASILVGALGIVSDVASTFVKELVKGLGITVIFGRIKTAVTDTVSSIRTDYNWKLVDTTDSWHNKTVYGSKYYITDVKSAVKGNTYYHGYVPKDWRTQALAVWFHNEMFAYPAWQVVSWS